MDPTAWYEVVGYAASLTVVVSLSMRSILRLRLIGLVGTVLFLVYGLLIGAIPIVITNVVIIGIHGYFVRRLLRGTEVFEVLQVRPDSLYLRRFLEFHADEIQRFQPGFQYEPADDTAAVLLLRDMVPAGLVIARPRPDDSLEIQLDFATPQYRDFELGRFLFSDDSGAFGSSTSAWSEPWSEAHIRYLRRMGFSESERDGRTVLQRRLGGTGTH